MKMVRNIMLVAVAGTLAFAQMSFHMGNNFSELDATMEVATSYGATWSLNDKAAIGYDSALGMLFHFDAGAVTFRMGWNGANDTSLGLGRSWDLFSSDGGLNTTISTNYDLVTTTGGADVEYDGNLSVVVGFGF